MQIKEEIRQEILARLQQIEKDEHINVFYACESGSRAWGFPSADSDYDVRFIYSRPVDWYLSIDEKRDVIERPIEDEIDVSGWDVKKALKLLRKSNPPLLEWLQSPIIYKKDGVKTDLLKDLIEDFYSPKASMYHYLNMAKNNFREYLHGETVWVKKYLYVLRPVLACRWISRDKGVVPMEFMSLVEGTGLSPSLQKTIQELVERKKQGDELRRESRIPELSDFLRTEIEKLSGRVDYAESTKGKTEKLDRVFREIVNR